MITLEDFQGSNIINSFFDEDLEKGRRGDPIGTEKKFGGVLYRKTLKGWRPVGHRNKHTFHKTLSPTEKTKSKILSSRSFNSSEQYNDLIETLSIVEDNDELVATLNDLGYDVVNSDKSFWHSDLLLRDKKSKEIVLSIDHFFKRHSIKDDESYKFQKVKINRLITELKIRNPFYLKSHPGLSEVANAHTARQLRAAIKPFSQEKKRIYIGRVPNNSTEPIPQAFAKYPRVYRANVVDITTGIQDISYFHNIAEAKRFVVEEVIKGNLKENTASINTVKGSVWANEKFQQIQTKLEELSSQGQDRPYAFFDPAIVELFRAPQPVGVENFKLVKKEKQTKEYLNLNRAHHILSQVLDRDAYLGNELSVSSLRGKGREYARVRAQEISIRSKSSTATILHELGHCIEYNNPEICEAVQVFLRRRVKNKPTVRLSKLIPNGEYQPSEFGRKGDFATPYVGKIYGGGSTEILSMWFSLASTDLHSFIEKDPAHFKLGLRILHNKL